MTEEFVCSGCQRLVSVQFKTEGDTVEVTCSHCGQTATVSIGKEKKDDQ